MAVLRDVLAQVRVVRGLDFRGYKTPMLVRRVHRRMGLARIASLPGYLEHLKTAPDEVAALAADFLIGVTEFFREPHAWAVLAEEIVPQIVGQKREGDALRVWVPACSTGEEAYSLAMVLLEQPRVTQLGLKLQIFATDVDRRALDTARRGHYDKAIEHAVEPARLYRFFHRSERGWQVSKELRDVVLFATHNLIGDPPFSHLDLVSCRNLLIYMTPPLQRQVLQTFHFALEPERFLFLGKSESVGSQAQHFAAASPRSRIFRRTGNRLAPPRLAALPPVPAPRQAAHEPAPPAAGCGPVVPGHAEAVLLAAVRPAAQGDAATVQALEEELRSTRAELRAVTAEFEATNEELKVANEEAMSANEELQSTNEELETSKEELQSVNEELITVNQELQQKLLELERSNDDLANLLANTHIPTLFLDRRLRIKRFTPDATRLFSLIAGDVGRPLSDISARCDMRSLLQDAERVLVELAPIERADRSDDGRYFLCRTLPYRTRDERIDGVVVTFVDITELERAAEGLRRFAGVMRGSDDSIVVHDLDGKVTDWNRGAQSMYGYSEAEAVGTSMAELLPEEAREAYREEIERALAGRHVPGVETRRRTRDGTVIDVSATFTVVRGADGKPGAVALIERDITQRKRAEAELRASEQRFRSLADRAPALIWTSDADGRVEFANHECETVLGRPAAALAGRRWTELLHPDDSARARAALTAVAVDSGRVDTTARVLVAGGEPRWMKLAVIPRSADSPLGPGHVGCMVDVHLQVEAEAVLRAADRRKDEFLAMLGHELRNPLVPIRNAAEVLKRSGGDERRIAWVHEVLVRQVDHVTRLVDDLLDIARITRGSLLLHSEPVDLGVVIVRAIDAVQSLLERKRHQLETRLPTEPLWVEGDPVRLAQVFENLLTNAAKYTDDGGEVSIALAREDDRAVVHVRDNGLGIEPAAQGRIFELFVQNERSLDRSQGGFGIGLSLVQRLVQLHGGQVEAHSAGIGRGSDFIVRLPVLDGRMPAAADEGAAAPPPAGGGRVLVIDDDADAAESLAMVLEMLGFPVAQAANLESAVRQARGFVPEVVVTDLAMPGADGYEVMRRLKTLPELAGTRYIALSGFGQHQDFERTRRAGFAKHFVKPVDPAELEQALRELLGAPGGTDGPAR